MIPHHSVHFSWRADFVAMRLADIHTENYVSFAGSSALTHWTVNKENSITLNALPHMKKKWKLLFQFSVQKRKLAVSASTSSGRRMVVNNVSESYRTAIIVSASSAFERGDKQSSLTTKSFALVLNVVLALISFAQVVSGLTILKKRNSSSLNTNQRSVKRIASTLRRWDLLMRISFSV